MQTSVDWKSRPFAVESLAQLAKSRTSALFTYVDEKGGESSLTADQARSAALKLAHALRHEFGLSPGDRVLLVYPPGLEFITALLGCMHAGVVAVPTAPPLLGVEAILAMAKDCQAKLGLTCRLFHEATALKPMIQSSPTPGFRWVASDALTLDAPWNPVPTEPDATAIIQYTSGSTGTPRGVCITYRNLQHQIAAERAALNFDETSRYAFWMPHYHDFGLITAISGAIHGNGEIIFSSPLAFLRRPSMWGDLVTQYRATHTAGPDFGFNLFTRRSTPDERAAWDFSSLIIVCSAGEPIRAATVDAFYEAMAVTGLKKGTFAPAYGLAEHTVGVAMHGTTRHRLSRRALEHDNLAVLATGEDTVEFFGNGPPGLDVDVRIVDPATLREVPLGHVGEIWADSASKAAGYFGRPEETLSTFHAKLEGSAGSYLRTGDLGAMVGGELIITGRIKDVVIVAGRNLYPQDVEEVVAQAHKAVRPGHVVCFGVDDGEREGVVVVAELRDDAWSLAVSQEVVSAARSAMQKKLGVGSFVFVLAKKDAVLRTTSGKLRRRACRDAYLSQQLPHHLVDRGIGGSL